MTAMRRTLCVLLCVLLSVLTGCASPLQEEQPSSASRLPDVRPGPEAPVGDSQSPRSSSAVLYVPSEDGTRLNTVVRTVTIEPGQTKQEAIMMSLLSLVEESNFHAGSEPIRLSTVSNAVETTRDLVTVNLFRSARSLSAQQQFALRMAIVNTLTELPDTNYVNILVDGRDIGIDAEETVPTGVLSRYPGNDVTLYWTRLETQRASTQGELQRTVALYFVSDDGNYLLGEVRNMVFAERGPAAFAKLILAEMAKGSTRISSARTLVPGQEFFQSDPQIRQTDDGMYLELHFNPQTEDFLASRGGTYAMMLSSICYTLTGFIPMLEGVVAYVDGEMITQMTLMNGDEWAMQSGQITRESVMTLAADVCTLYYPLANGVRLYASTRPIAQRLRNQPRALMRELLEPPRSALLGRAIPEGVTDADIIGLRIQEDTALINVSAAFGAACQGMSRVQERNMIYAIVNTLTEIEGVSRVRFFIEGEQSQLAGHLFIGGEFMRHPGLVYSGQLEATAMETQ